MDLSRAAGSRRHKKALLGGEWLELLGDPVLHFHDARRKSESPELRLFAAILDDVRICLFHPEVANPTLRAEAIAWVKGDLDSVPLCSFREICAMLDLDEERARGELLRRSASGARDRCPGGLERPRISLVASTSVRKKGNVADANSIATLGRDGREAYAAHLRSAARPLRRLNQLLPECDRRGLA